MSHHKHHIVSADASRFSKDEAKMFIIVDFKANFVKSFFDKQNFMALVKLMSQVYILLIVSDF